MFFKQWDEKHQNLGTVLYNNYIQALNMILPESVALAEAMMLLGITESDLEQWHNEEVEYFGPLAVSQSGMFMQWLTLNFCRSSRISSKYFLSSVFTAVFKYLDHSHIPNKRL